MPPVLTPNNQWLAAQFQRSQEQTRALSAQQTEYILNPSTSVCEAIIGHLQYDHQGNPTGLGDVWGIASHKTGSWVRI